MSINSVFRFLALVCFIFTPVAHATSNYDYKNDEYVPISNGTSPNKKWIIKAHGEGSMGYDNFHLYLVDATANKIVGPLTEVTDTLDTGADAFAAKWTEDSTTVTIVYRVSRHAPLKAITYKLTKGRAFPKTKEADDVTSKELTDHWKRYGSGYFNPDGSRKDTK